MSFSVIFVLRVVFRGGFGNDFSFHELLLWIVERSYVLARPVWVTWCDLSPSM